MSATIGLRLILALLSVRCVAGQAPAAADHHQHLYSPTAAALSGLKPISAHDLTEQLDRAGIRRAIVLSVAYSFSNPNKPPVDDEYAKVKAENDWTSAQVALFPDRLRGFCGVNPLKSYAVDEIARCARDPNMRFGVKMHFGNSDVQLDNPRHVTQVRRVFRAANDHGMAIAVHMHSSVTLKRPYGSQQARVFLNELLPAAPDVTIQIAHMAGAGGYDEPEVDDAVGIFVNAIRSKDPRMAHVWFDVSGVAGLGNWRARADLLTQRMRQLGLTRLLYGSDAPTPDNLPVDVLAKFRELPLSRAEFEIIEGNVAPYLR